MHYFLYRLRHNRIAYDKRPICHYTWAVCFTVMSLLLHPHMTRRKKAVKLFSYLYIMVSDLSAANVAPKVEEIHRPRNLEFVTRCAVICIIGLPALCIINVSVLPTETLMMRRTRKPMIQITAPKDTLALNRLRTCIASRAAFVVPRFIRCYKVE